MCTNRGFSLHPPAGAARLYRTDLATLLCFSKGHFYVNPWRTKAAVTLAFYPSTGHLCRRVSHSRSPFKSCCTLLLYIYLTFSYQWKIVVNISHDERPVCQIVFRDHHKISDEPKDDQGTKLCSVSRWVRFLFSMADICDEEIELSFTVWFDEQNRNRHLMISQNNNNRIAVRKKCVCVLETFCTCKILISNVSIARVSCDQDAAREAVIFRVKKNKFFILFFFAVISFDWTSLDAVSDAQDNSGATFPKMG